MFLWVIAASLIWSNDLKIGNYVTKFTVRKTFGPVSAFAHYKSTSVIWIRNELFFRNQTINMNGNRVEVRYSLEKTILFLYGNRLFSKGSDIVLLWKRYYFQNQYCSWPEHNFRTTIYIVCVYWVKIEVNRNVFSWK